MLDVTEEVVVELSEDVNVTEEVVVELSEDVNVTDDVDELVFQLELVELKVPAHDPWTVTWISVSRVYITEACGPYRHG